MENKNLIIVAVVVVVIVAIAGIIFATGMLNGNSNNNLGTSQLKTEFIEGSFVGNVTLENDTQKFMHSYEDKEHHITYNVSTVDNSSQLMEVYELQGVSNPEKRTFNGNDWNIYFTQAMPGNNTNNTDSSKTMNIVICQSQGDKQGYLIYAIFDNSSDVDVSGKMFSPGYKEYIEPLLKSISLKESKNVPKINEEFGLTEDEFSQQLDLIHQYKSGNLSALQG
jgi:Tfp pilus assembly protein PilE